MNMFGFYASDYYRGKIEEILLKSLDRKFQMPKYRKCVVRVFTDLLHSIQETVLTDLIQQGKFADLCLKNCVVSAFNSIKS